MAKDTTKPVPKRRDMTSAEVRYELSKALELDLIGPWPGSGYEAEMLDQNPFRWYLTGFLVPVNAEAVMKAAEVEEGSEEVAEEGGGVANPDSHAPDPGAAKLTFFPSSIGISVLLRKETEAVKVTVRWGDYRHVALRDGEEGSETERRRRVWKRTPREESLSLKVPQKLDGPAELDIPYSQGLQLVLTVKPSDFGSEDDGGLPKGTRAASIFLVNNRTVEDPARRDESFAFQAQLEITCSEGFVPRPDPRGATSTDWDDRVADLQYRDVLEFAVGHGVATEASRDSMTTCSLVRTAWIPKSDVEHVAPAPLGGVELSMESLASLANATELAKAVGELPKQYRAWIKQQDDASPKKPARWAQTAKTLMDRANYVATRVERGIQVLSDPVAFEAFQTANRAMAVAARQRNAVLEGKPPADVNAPKWRPFQLAFLLMSLPTIVNPKDADREALDLLFFPTGGGKTEAYLGLAAFTIVLRRLRNEGLDGAGVTVLMRYTLRLLTLDQLNRAATLICALELERQQPGSKLGPWPIEIGLWVGQGATPNKMGKKGENKADSARKRVTAFKAGKSKNAPIPMGTCPWCGHELKPNCFALKPTEDNPTDLRITCMNRDCAFTKNRPLPVLGVDEPIYRRLPAFLIATVDKFASLPWEGRVGTLFGKVSRADGNGFYGPMDPKLGSALPKGSLLPPELIIQDELHLISGPLGTMTGLYEVALDALSSRNDGDAEVRPKIVASTATVRRAEKQALALFNRRPVEVFPPPGPDRRTSFFAVTQPQNNVPPRQYLGIAAQGRSPKVVMLRTYLALMSSAQKLYHECGGRANPDNPVDPYMSMLGYFNSLRELGGSRRIIEDEIAPRLKSYGSRLRVGEQEGWYADRDKVQEVLELTSRVSTSAVADARRRLGLAFVEEQRVDVAIATNMISVGLDIPRLGMMVVFGQPKTHSEYIQATSRVGRTFTKPGFVVTMFNIHKPRDRSHYERFSSYHDSFYRHVEPTSATPFAMRALDRGLAGMLVGLVRQSFHELTPPQGAEAVGNVMTHLAPLRERIVRRALDSIPDSSAEEKQDLRERIEGFCKDLLDKWEALANKQSQHGHMRYQEHEGGEGQQLLYGFLDEGLKRVDPRHQSFRASRSLRDVEPSVNVWVRTLDPYPIELDGDDT